MEKSQNGESKGLMRKKTRPKLNLFPLDPEREPKALPQPSEGEVEEVEVSWVTAFHRPSYYQLLSFKEIYGITLVVTCMGSTENPDEIKKFWSTLGIKNVRINIRGANKVLLSTK
jgi:hypothetical protein